MVILTIVGLTLIFSLHVILVQANPDNLREVTKPREAKPSATMTVREGT